MQHDYNSSCNTKKLGTAWRIEDAEEDQENNRNLSDLKSKC